MKYFLGLLIPLLLLCVFSTHKEMMFEKALKMRLSINIYDDVPERWHCYDKLGVAMMENLARSKKPDYTMYSFGAEFLEKAHHLNPYDSTALIHRMQLDAVAYSKKLIKHPSNFVTRKLKYLKQIDPLNTIPGQYIKPHES